MTIHIRFRPMDTHEELKASELTETQKKELRAFFEPEYGRELTDQELWEIHFNLTRFFIAVSQVS